MEEDIKILDHEEIQEKLKDLPGWIFENDKIKKQFVFDSFMQGLGLVNNLAPFCERIDHHPDIHIFYKKILFELQRYSAGGKVTDRDFEVAKEIERLYAKAKG
ncbi:MAG TPA: 4a-hydroxytetrahydrobiopterin dehydratase [Patescibacteria group bacterium]